jgi:hypothetical protein
MLHHINVDINVDIAIVVVEKPALCIAGSRLPIDTDTTDSIHMRVFTNRSKSRVSVPIGERPVNAGRDKERSETTGVGCS